MKRAPITLIAEDDENDFYLFERAFQTCDLRSELQWVRDGDETIDYLSGEGPYADREAHPMPFLVILDLKMPRRDGFEVLEWARQRRDLRQVIFVILSSSALRQDVQRAYQLGANSYLMKPAGDAYLDLVGVIGEYWFRWNQHPALANPLEGVPPYQFDPLRDHARQSTSVFS